MSDHEHFKPQFSVDVTEEGEDNYTTSFVLPVDSADADCAEQLAYQAMKAINAMLSKSKATTRVGFFDKATGERVHTTENK